MKKMGKTALIFLKGIAMGTCDVIPGVSGGTIAFITGIYDRLIDALNHINKKSFMHIMQGKITQARRYCDGQFLVTLFAGIIVAILSFAKLIQYGMTHHPILVWGFFFGLIITSALMLLQHIKKRTTGRGVSIAVGIAIGYIVSTLPIMNNGGESLRSIGISGAIAIIAMILPGISGSYMLLVMGKYNIILSSLTSIIDAMKNMTLSAEGVSSAITLLVFMAGCVIGLLLFSKLLHWIKNNYHDTMVAVLTGFMLGAITKVRPRQQVVSTYQDRHGIEQTLKTINILPTIAQDLWSGIATIGLGIVVVTLIHYIAKHHKAGKKQTM